MISPNDEMVGRVVKAVEGRIRPRIIAMANRQKELETEVSRFKNLYSQMVLERATEMTKRDANHLHASDQPSPVLVFDLDGTLKEDPNASYPLADVAPRDGVKAALDKFVAQGCCLHLATAGLYYGNQQDLDVYYSRMCQIDAWLKRHGLPITLILPKSPSDCFYDDRMVPAGAGLDWADLADEAQRRLSLRFSLVDGRWERKQRAPRGTPYDEFPRPEDAPQEMPRGFSGPRLDADIHRTVSEASSSKMIAAPKPGAVERLTELYNQGVSIYLSCAGWNPATHNDKETVQGRLAGIRQWLADNSIPYDRLVSKDHGDLFFDDKGVAHVNWDDDYPAICSTLEKFSGQRLTNADAREGAMAQ